MTMNVSPSPALSSRVLRLANRSAFVMLLSLVVAAAFGCGRTQPFMWASAHPSLRVPPPAHQLGADDKLLIFVRGQKELTGERTVSREGDIVQPLLGAIKVNGLTTVSLRNLLAQRLSKFISNPDVSVSLVSARELRITALGEVRTPGQFKVPSDESILGVLGRAGGLTDFADDSAIYLVRKGQRIRFRFKNLVEPDATITFRLQDGDNVVVD